MNLPDTDNPSFQHAFKKGYRLALDGKSMGSLPSEIRRDMELRQYFQLGWEQAQQDLAFNLQALHKPNWRARLGWFVILMLGGLSTGALMVNNVKTEQAQKTKPTDQATAQPPQAAKPIEPSSLSLLSNAQREDLNASSQSQQQIITLPLQPILPTHLHTATIIKTHLEGAIAPNETLQSFKDHVPKHIRTVQFYSTLNQSTSISQTVYHRWRFNEQIIQTAEFKLSQPQQTLSSQQPLSNAWLGTWHIELLDAKQSVIFRHTFQFGNAL
jgi:ribosome modulation factor